MRWPRCNFNMRQDGDDGDDPVILWCERRRWHGRTHRFDLGGTEVRVPFEVRLPWTWRIDHRIGQFRHWWRSRA